MKKQTIEKLFPLLNSWTPLTSVEKFKYYDGFIYCDFRNTQFYFDHDDEIMFIRHGYITLEGTNFLGDIEIFVREEDVVDPGEPGDGGEDGGSGDEGPGDGTENGMMNVFTITQETEIKGTFFKVAKNLSGKIDVASFEGLTFRQPQIGDIVRFYTRKNGVLTLVDEEEITEIYETRNQFIIKVSDKTTKTLKDYRGKNTLLIMYYSPDFDPSTNQGIHLPYNTAPGYCFKFNVINGGHYVNDTIGYVHEAIDYENILGVFFTHGERTQGKMYRKGLT